MHKAFADACLADVEFLGEVEFAEGLARRKVAREDGVANGFEDA
jgi:hypothetical protein